MGAYQYLVFHLHAISISILLVGLGNKSKVLSRFGEGALSLITSSSATSQKKFKKKKKKKECYIYIIHIQQFIHTKKFIHTRILSIYKLPYGKLSLYLHLKKKEKKTSLICTFHK